MVISERTMPVNGECQCRKRTIHDLPISYFSFPLPYLPLAAGDERYVIYGEFHSSLSRFIHDKILEVSLRNACKKA